MVREAGTFLAHRCQEIGQKRAQANDLIAQAEDITQPRTPANRRALRQQADQLHQQAQAIEKRWGMGSNGRLLLTALTAAAGGNVTGSAGAMLQAAAVNTLQGLGARQVKLIADSLESETARTALHAVLAGIGAAAQGQNITSAALGAGASVVLNNLVKVAYEQDEQDPLNLEQREACKNLVTTLIAGTTQALGGEAAVAATAASIEMENNYLHAKDEQRRQNAQWAIEFQKLPADEEAVAQQLVAELNSQDQALDLLLRESCQSLDSQQCQIMRSDLQAAVQSYQEKLPGQYIGNIGTVYTRGKRKVDALIFEYATVDAKAAREESIKLIAANHDITLEKARKLYDTVNFLHTGAAIAGSVYGIKGANVSKFPKPLPNTGSKPMANSRRGLGKNLGYPVSKTEKFTEYSAHNTTSGLRLKKSLASEAQLASLIKDGGKAFAGAGVEELLRDAPRLVATYGGKPEDWSKVVSGSYKAIDGAIFEIHAYRNVVTGELVEAKTVLTILRKR